jgi:hypothetical protein
LYLADVNGAIWRTRDDGSSWVNVREAGSTNIYLGINWIVENSDTLLIGTNGESLFRSVNQGRDWEQITSGLPASNSMWDVAIVKDKLYGISYEGFYVSSDFGASWSDVDGSNSISGNCVEAIGNTLFVGGKGMKSSRDGGKTWQSENTGFENDIGVSSISANSTYVFAGTNQGVWRRPLNQIVSVENTSVDQPHLLTTITPNPSAASFHVRYSLASTSDVEFSITDYLGRVVRAFPSAGKEAGVHNLEWDSKDSSGASLPTGSYFLRMKAGTSVQTNMVVIIR